MTDRQASWALGAATALFYLCFHSYLYNFDGVACAIAVELGDYSVLVHSNHLAYGVLGRLFFRLWQLLGYEGPALLALQTLNSLLGAAAAGVFHSALRRARLPATTAVGATLCLVGSQAFWLWSLEAQVYPLGALGIALTLREALSPKPRPAALGLCHAAAILGHVGHLMFTPAAVWALWRRAPQPRAAFAKYVAAAACLLTVVYVWAGVFCVAPRNIAELKIWLLGSAALTVNREFAWHGGYMPKMWALMTLRIFSDWVAAPAASRAFSAALAVGCLACAGLGLWRARAGQRGYEAALCALWLAGYAALFMSWEAFTVVYRITDLMPFWLLAALAFEARKRWVPGALAAALIVFNGWSQILPRTDPARNREYQEALWLARSVPEDAWVVVFGSGQVYVPYFSHRKPLNMRFFDHRPPDALFARLDAIAAQGQRVFVTERTLSATPWGDWLRGYGLVATASASENVLYEVRRTGSPKAAGRKS